MSEENIIEMTIGTYLKGNFIVLKMTVFILFSIVLAPFIKMLGDSDFVLKVMDRVFEYIQEMYDIGFINDEYKKQLEKEIFDQLY